MYITCLTHCDRIVFFNFAVECSNDRLEQTSLLDEYILEIQHTHTHTHAHTCTYIHTHIHTHLYFSFSLSWSLFLYIMQLVFSHATSSRIYYSSDNGLTWMHKDFIPTSINPRSLVLNLRLEQWAIAHDSVNDSMYVTKNLGSSWINVADNVTNYHW